MILKPNTLSINPLEAKNKICLSLLTVDDVQEKVQYHSACITNYLLKWKKEHRADNYSTIKNESEHGIAFKKFLDILHRDLPTYQGHLRKKFLPLKT
jgi:hypothetical protein